MQKLQLFHIQCILDYPAMLGNLSPKSWPDKNLARKEKYLSQGAHRPPPTPHLKEPKEKTNDKTIT